MVDKQYLFNYEKFNNSNIVIKYIENDQSNVLTALYKLPKKYIQEDKVMEQTAPSQDERLFCFISELTEESIESTSSNLQNIINYR